MYRTARLLLSVVVVAFLSTPSVAAKFNPLTSVKPLQLFDGENFQTYCTAWKARLPNDRQVWVTAAHCVPTSPDMPFYIGSVKTRVLAISYKKDIAALEGGPSAQPLQIAFKSPAALTSIYSAGYPGNFHSNLNPSEQHVVMGVWSHIRKDGLAAYSMPVAHGMSGGPVFDDGGVVVGLMNQTECNWIGWCPGSAGATVETIRAFLGLELR